MRNKPKIYGKVLSETLEGKSRAQARELIKRFKTLLKKRGDLRFLYQILKEYQELQEEKEGKPAQVIFASLPSERLKNDLKTSLGQKGFQMKEKINPQVIGGAAMFLGREFLIDGTVRGRLQKIAKLLNG